MSNQTPQSVGQPKPFNSTIDALLWAVEQFKAGNPGATDESIGWRGAKDSSIIERLRSGGDCTTRKRDALIRYMSNPKRK